MNILIVYLLIFLGVLGIAFFLKLIKGAVKIMFILSFIVLIVLAVLGFFIVEDAKDFKENFPSEPKSFILEKEGKYVAGFKFASMDIDEIEFLGNDRLLELQEANSQEELGLVMEDNFKLFFFNYSQFNESLVNGINYQGFPLNQSLANEIFSSNDSMQVLADVLEVPIGVVQTEFTSDEEIKGAYFAILIFDTMQENPRFIMDSLKSGEITLYPETILIKTLKFIPESMYEQALGIINEN